ncbi:MAG: gliding motility-associated protein GldE [Bacteroidales bacterium]
MEEPDSDPHLWLLNIFLEIFTGNLNSGVLFGILSVIVLLIFSALISGSEIAFFSLNPAHLKDINSVGSKSNKLIITLLDIPKRLLATILIANNFVNVAIIILSSYIMRMLFDFSEYPLLSFSIEVLVITFFILFFGEIMPKIFANQKPLAFATFMSRPINFLIMIFYPVSSLLVKSTKLIDKKLSKTTHDFSMSDISDAIDITVDESTHEEETKILKGIVKFTDIEVREIMRSRMDLVAVESGTGFDKLIEIVVESGYSRIPVYTESLDNINGVLYVKDLLQHLDKKEGFEWLPLVRPAFFIPENKKINDLLQEFQEKKIHLAIVVDEYGGTSGIVSLEDIIEEIIGEITDEFDTPEDAIGYKKIDANNFIFEGKTSINDFCKIIEIDDDVFDEVKGDADSLAGVILELLGEIPEKDTKIIYQHFEFKILTVDQRRIKQIKVTLRGKVKEDEETK